MQAGRIAGGPPSRPSCRAARSGGSLQPDFSRQLPAPAAPGPWNNRRGCGV